ncbi:hypothetical protein RJ639_037290 [Escallonia herrerae]|uniref:Uncharacterized protein n=1 Tax=Escallonia herrerae TaxID=1293975 RepID=A0AA89BD48_9ASTE|nr:hypothetical protein RJ639_037290 [Escallonia herrerae]
MHALWVFLKDTVNFSCSRKLTDVICEHEKRPRRISCGSIHNSEGEQLLHGLRNPMHRMPYRENYTRSWFYGRLSKDIGDPSRNVIEMIFRAASPCPPRDARRITEVLKVNNSMESLERFEEYRETVKKECFKQHKRHPRGMVDGNELLQFYGATIICCSDKQYGVSDLCKDPNCRVCRIIQSGFKTACNKRAGILMNTSSNAMSEAMNVTTEKNLKRAVILCRVVAGRVCRITDWAQRDDYDSIRSGQNSKLDHLIVRDPSAVLPCFIIVFN